MYDSAVLTHPALFRTARAAFCTAVLLLVTGVLGQDLPQGVQYELRATADPLAVHVLTVKPFQLQLTLERPVSDAILIFARR